MPPKPSDRFIPYYFVVFFVLLAALLFWFVDLAVSTNTGVVTDNAYNKGLEYNKTIAKAEQQEKLGWRPSIKLDGKDFTFSLLDKNSKPISEAKVVARFIRPTQDGFDKDFTLTNEGEGQYKAKLDLALQGVWDVTVKAVANDQQFQYSQRIILK